MPNSTVNTTYIYNVAPGFSKRAIASRLVEDDKFMLACLGILYSRQTDTEQARRETIVKNRRGFMSSHAVNGTALAERLAKDGSLPNDDSFKGKPVSSLEMARSIVVRYSKQLAEHFRTNPKDAERCKPAAPAPEAESIEDGWEA
jgi:hypothetical protein